MLALELPPQASTPSSETVGNWPEHRTRTHALYGRTHTSPAVRVETLLHTHLSLVPPCELLSTCFLLLVADAASKAETVQPLKGISRPPLHIGSLWQVYTSILECLLAGH